MPERPDLEHQVPILDRELGGRTITGVQVGLPVVLRVAVPGRIAELLPGHRFTGARRQLHFVRLALDPPAGADPLELVVHPMLAGRFQLCRPSDRMPKDCGLAFTLDDGRQLRYRDSEQMGKVYLVPRDRPELVPGLQPVGVDVLDPSAFTLAVFRALCKKRRDQVKLFLMDKAVLDSFGPPQRADGGWDGHVFNLGHGISQHTPPEHVTALVEAVHAHSRRLRNPG